MKLFREKNEFTDVKYLAKSSRIILATIVNYGTCSVKVLDIFTLNLLFQDEPLGYFPNVEIEVSKDENYFYVRGISEFDSLSVYDLNEYSLLKSLCYENQEGASFGSFFQQFFIIPTQYDFDGGLMTKFCVHDLKEGHERTIPEYTSFTNGKSQIDNNFLYVSGDYGRKIYVFEVLSLIEGEKIEYNFDGDEEYQLFLKSLDYNWIEDFIICSNTILVKDRNQYKHSFNFQLSPSLIMPISIKNGFALNIHTLNSVLEDSGRFNTTRTKIGEMLYQLKYNFNIAYLDEISSIAADSVLRLFEEIQYIIPVPPSNRNRPFQPVFELAKKISNTAKIPIDLEYLKKSIITPELKEIDDIEYREKVLQKAFSIPDKRYKDKSILLFDDLYRSGATLNAATKVLKEQGEVGNVFVLTITKTRTKR